MQKFESHQVFNKEEAKLNYEEGNEAHIKAPLHRPQTSNDFQKNDVLKVPILTLDKLGRHQDEPLINSAKNTSGKSKKLTVLKSFKAKDKAINAIK